MDGATTPSPFWSRGGGESQSKASARASNGSCVEYTDTRAFRSDDDDLEWTSLAFTEAVAIDSARG